MKYSSKNFKKSSKTNYNQQSEPNYEEQKRRLKNLYEKEILSFSEYHDKLQKIEDSESDFNLKESEEYNQLDELKKDGILTEEEFQDKITKLKRDFNSKTVTSTVPPLNPKLISFKGYQKAKQIYDKAQTEKDSATIDGLKKRFEKIFKIEGGEDSKVFVEEVFSQLEEKQDIKIMSPFIEDVALVMDTQMNYGYRDSNYDFIVEPRYQFAAEFNEDLAVVRLEDKFGYINKKGETAISLLYDDADSFKNGRAKVRKGKEKFYIDKKGNKKRS